MGRCVAVLGGVGGRWRDERIVRMHLCMYVVGAVLAALVDSVWSYQSPKQSP